MMLSKSTPAVLATLFFGLSLGGSALACSMDGWDSNSGAVAVGQPFYLGPVPPGEVNPTDRFEQYCAMQATGTGNVRVSTALSHSAFWNRLYVLLNAADFSGAGDAKILVALDDVDGELFSISYNKTHLNFNTPGGSASIAVGPGWHVIEYNVDYGADADGNMDIWVDSDATTDLADASITDIVGGARGPAAVVEAIEIGLPDGLDTFGAAQVNFDSFALTSTMASGPLDPCQPDPSNPAFNISDVVAIIGDYGLTALSDGTPNCHPESGDITISDVVAAITIYANP